MIKEINGNIYRHLTKIQLRFMDLDVLMHVNNARYLNFLEEARLSYSNDVIQLFGNLSELNVVVARIEIDYKSPIFYPNEVLIWTRVSHVGNKSFEFDSLIGIEKNGSFTIAAKSIQTIVFYDPTLKKSTSFPEEFKNKIKNYEAVN
tara:strand:+ start:1350 stop:1790 length:441 start_codon:yes stop_codon:yes gene_type:complete